MTARIRLSRESQRLWFVLDFGRFGFMAAINVRPVTFSTIGMGIHRELGGIGARFPHFYAYAGRFVEVKS